MKKDRGYILFVGGLLVLLIVFLLLQPDQISWNPSYSHKHTLPFGSRAVYERLEDLFPEQPIEATYVPAYEMAQTLLPDSGSSTDANYLLVRHYASFDEYDTKAICRMVEAGAHVFIAAEGIAGPLADTLGINVQMEMFKGEDLFADPDTLYLNFDHADLHTEKGFAMRPGENDLYVVVPDSVKDVEVLGRNSWENPVFVRKNKGKGAIYFHSVPLAFTNYYLLPQNNSGYVSRCFSYLPVAPVYWDEYYKAGRQGAGTPIRVLLQKPALKMALIVTLALVLVYMLFQSKRRQRIIPVMKPFENSTLQFVGTVARLYYNRGEHTSLAKKKVMYWMERLRLRYQTRIDFTDEESLLAVSARSGVDVEETRKVFRFSHHLRMAVNVSEKELIEYNKLVEEFWKKAR